MTRKCSLCRQEGHQRNHCSNSPFGGAFVHSIKSVDDTPPSESDESITRREMDELLFECIKKLSDEILEAFEDRDKVIRALMLRVANLEARKPPQDTNPDPEWYA